MKLSASLAEQGIAAVAYAALPLLAATALPPDEFGVVSLQHLICITALAACRQIWGLQLVVHHDARAYVRRAVLQMLALSISAAVIAALLALSLGHLRLLLSLGLLLWLCGAVLTEAYRGVAYSGRSKSRAAVGLSVVAVLSAGSMLVGSLVGIDFYQVVLMGGVVTLTAAVLLPVCVGRGEVGERAPTGAPPDTSGFGYVHALFWPAAIGAVITTWLIGRGGSVSDVGSYRLAQTLAGLAVQPLAWARPWFVSLVKERLASTGDFPSRVLGRFGVISALSAAAAWALSVWLFDGLLTSIFDENWAGARTVLLPVLVSLSAVQVFGLIEAGMRVLGDLKILAVLRCVGALVITLGAALAVTQVSLMLLVAGFAAVNVATLAVGFVELRRKVVQRRGGL